MRVFEGQKVITKSGQVVTVAFVRYGQVWAYGANGLPKPVDICCEAWGGDHDMNVANEAA